MPRKEQPKVELAKLLRRRKLTLARFVSDFGITTYVQFCQVCKSLGVEPPIEDDFKSVVTKPVTNLSEGVAIIDEDFVEDESDAVDDGIKTKPRRSRRKKVDLEAGES